jgi:hypothetical protein
LTTFDVKIAILLALHAIKKTSAQIADQMRVLLPKKKTQNCVINAELVNSCKESIAQIVLRIAISVVLKTSVRSVLTHTT